MRRSPTVLVALAVLVAAAAHLAGAPPAAAAAAELVPNGGFETAGADPATPAGWARVWWGDISATFSRPADGAHGGTASARVDVSERASGAATYAFDAQPVTAGARYRYSSWYRASVTSEVLAVFTTTAGTTAYQWLRDLDPVAAWAPVSALVTAPADAARVTVFHSIADVGFVQTDDVSVAPFDSAPPPSLGIVVNGDLERGDPFDPGEPVAWQAVRWGNHIAEFSHPTTDAHSGSRSARVEVSGYRDGGATWAFDTQPVQAGADYRFAAWYRSDRPVEVVAVISMANGSTRYGWMGVVQPSAAWRPFTGSFVAPAGAVSVTVYQTLTSVGWVEVDDVSVSPYRPRAFDRPLVSLTFDDGYRSNVTEALPTLVAAGLKGTFYLTPGDFDSEPPPAFLRRSEVAQLAAAGMEIGGHTLTHPHLTELSADEQEEELRDSQADLRELTGQPVSHFASPFGEYDDDVVDLAMGLYESHRTVDDGYNQRDTLDFTRIRARMVLRTTTLADVQSWLAHARQEGLWLVLVFHDLIDEPDFYDTTPATFRSIIDAVKASGTTVATVDQAHTELVGQTRARG